MTMVVVNRDHALMNIHNLIDELTMNLIMSSTPLDNSFLQKIDLTLLENDEENYLNLRLFLFLEQVLTHGEVYKSMSFDQYGDHVLRNLNGGEFTMEGLIGGGRVLTKLSKRLTYVGIFTMLTQPLAWRRILMVLCDFYSTMEDDIGENYLDLYDRIIYNPAFLWSECAPIVEEFLPDYLKSFHDNIHTSTKVGSHRATFTNLILSVSPHTVVELKKMSREDASELMLCQIPPTYPISYSSFIVGDGETGDLLDFTAWLCQVNDVNYLEMYQLICGELLKLMDYIIERGEAMATNAGEVMATETLMKIVVPTVFEKMIKFFRVYDGSMPVAWQWSLID